MKKILFILGLMHCVSIVLTAQPPRIDSVAVLILQRMSNTINDLKSLSFTVNTDMDLSSDELGLVKHSNCQKINITKPDKMMVSFDGDEGKRSIWYNGQLLSFYSFDNNRYAQVKAPPTILQVIDSAHKKYEIDFPAADLLYPTLVDDILDTAYNLIYLGITSVGGEPCFHIAGTMPEMTFQFWVRNDEFFLPAKMVLVYTSRDNTPQYQATFSDWKLNQSLPVSMFDFQPPPKAEKIKLVSRSVNK